MTIVTLGCPKNESDSDFIKGQLSSFGYNLVCDPQIADVIVINTCGFIEPAKQESIETIFEYANYKEEGKCKVLAVVGCLAQRYPDELFKEIPEIDILLGVNCWSKLPEKISEFLKGGRILQIDDPSSHLESDFTRAKPDLPFAYLKISDGCNSRCSYCAIPFIKGSYHSLSIDKLIDEVKYLTSNGVREIILVGQDTGNYGVDIYSERKLPELILNLSKIEQLDWIRLMYIQPDGLSEDLLTVMATDSKVCNYVDIPFQHSSEKILRMMRRNGCGKDYLSLVDKARDRIPGVVIRSSLIVGFPGESDEDFEDLLAFTKDADLDYLGVFEYFAEEGTAAATLSSQVLKEVKRERYHQLTCLQDSITLEKNKRYIGQEIKTLTESHEEGEIFLGRSQYQAPEIDGIVYIKGCNGQDLKVGDFVLAKITGFDGYDLVGDAEC